MLDSRSRQLEHQARVAAKELAKVTGIAIRQSEREKRTPEEQIALLDERLGVGAGAKRERARLRALVEVGRNTKVVEVSTETVETKVTKTKRKGSSRRKATAKKARRAS